MPKNIIKIRGPIRALILGEKKESRKFHIQFVALPNAILFALTRRGNDSPRYTHGVGPQNIEKAKTWRTAKAIMTSPPDLLR